MLLCSHLQSNLQAQSFWRTELTIFVRNMHLEAKSIRSWPFLKPVNVRKVESCLLIEDELSLDRGLADFVWVSRAFCKVIFYDVRYSSRHSFNWMCFCEVFVSCCQSLQRVYARNITAKSTCRLAYECGALSSLNGVTSSFFGKYPSLPGALLVKCLQSSHLYHLTILNGGEVTTLSAL